MAFSFFLSPQLTLPLLKLLGRGLETTALLVEEFPRQIRAFQALLVRGRSRCGVWPWPRQCLHLSIPKCHFEGVFSSASRVKFQNLHSLPELPVCLATGLYFHQKNRKRGTYGFYKCQRDAYYMPAWEAWEGIWTTESFPALYSGGTGNSQFSVIFSTVRSNRAKSPITQRNKMAAKWPNMKEIKNKGNHLWKSL